MNILNKRPKWLGFLFIFFGSGLIALATSMFYDPVGMVTGGFGGVAIILKDFTSRIFKNSGIPLWLTNAVLNIPLFLFAFKKHGGKYLLRTFLAVAFLSFWLLVIPSFAPIKDDLFLTSIFGGVTVGIGLGMVLLYDTTTGGTDMLAVLIHDGLRNRFSISQIMQVIDAVIVIAGVVVFGIKTSLYAIISIYIAMKIIDAMLEGTKFAKAAFIITDMRTDVTNAIFDNLGRGVTAIDCTGMYSKKDKTMLMCVVSKTEIFNLRCCVANSDPKAFIIISDVREVFGEGFIEDIKK